jgi:hypothetical protein
MTVDDDFHLVAISSAVHIEKRASLNGLRLCFKALKVTQMKCTLGYGFSAPDTMDHLLYK